MTTSCIDAKDVFRGCHQTSGVHRQYPSLTIRVSGRPVTKKASRHAYEECIGPIPDGMIVMHTCDNPRCVSPEHLRCGTQKENIQDAIAKGRFTMGSRHHRSKLTERDVAEIRSSALGSSTIARILKVSHRQINKIRARGAWRQVSR